MTIEEAKKWLVTVARFQVGYKEGTNNWNKYADDSSITKLYGWNVQNQPWCCTFVNWCFINAFGYDVGSKMTYGGSAACGNAARLFMSNGSFGYMPDIGDQAFFYSGGNINHTGVVVEVNGSSFTTIEGNYSDKVSEVYHKVGDSDVAGFGRPNWCLVSGLEESNSQKPVSSTLKKGSYGDSVKALQERLISLGYSCGADGADGQYGNNTMKAVAEFQEDHHLTVAGEVDTITLDMINKADNPEKDDVSHAWRPPLLTLSDKYSANVVVLQSILNVRHWACGSADGFFGPKTEAAVNRARAHYGLGQNGKCDNALWKHLLSF